MQGISKGRQGLPRQSVHQVYIDRLDPGLAAGLERAEGQFGALYPVDGQLHFSIEILHAQAHAVDAEPGQLCEVTRAAVAWIDFDGKLVAGAKAKMTAEPAHDGSQLLGREEVGCAATKMQLPNLALTEKRRHHVDFALQPIDVR